MRETPYFPLFGGLDQVTPIIQMPDGKMIAGDNFEPWITGGYRRMRGYERFDGRPKPHQASWVWLTLADATGLTTGTVLTGDTSAATGTVVSISGNEVAVTKVTGTFVVELANTGAYSITAAAVDDGPDITTELAFRLAAENEYRGDITQVPGINPIRGIWQIRDRVYAIRDNAGATAGIIHKATAAGWDDTPISYAVTVRFTGGTNEPAIGDTLTGATSAATGTVHKVVIHSGSFGGSDAAGYFALTGVTGTYTSGENLQVSAVTQAVAGENSSTFALSVGGRYDFVSENFLANATTYRVYGCNGVDPAFEIDENDVVTPILLDLSLGDAPSENNPFLVESFDGALWLMFPGGSLQKSITGDPLTFNGFLGAAEFGLGEEGTGLINSAGRVLIALTRRQTHGFFPTDVAYQKRLLSDRSGGILYSATEIDSVLVVDDSGLVDLQRAEVFGDFANSTVSDPVQPIMFANRDRIAGTMAVKESNQLRIHYTNGTGVMCRRTLDGPWEFSTFNLGLENETLNVCYTCEDIDTAPTYYWGGSSGFVYQSEVGRNFDGNEIESFVKLPFNHQGSPAVRKRYRLAEVDIKATERVVTLRMGQDRDYGDQQKGTSNWNDGVDTAFGGGSFYDISNWDESYWDSQAYDFARFELLGTGRNVSLLLYHRDAVTEPFVLEGVILHFDPRRVQR